MNVHFSRAEETQTITFETSHFSEYAVGVSNTPIPVPSEPHNQGLALAIFLVLAIIIPVIIALVYFKE